MITRISFLALMPAAETNLGLGFRKAFKVQDIRCWGLWTRAWGLEILVLQIFVGAKRPKQRSDSTPANLRVDPPRFS